MTASGRSFSIAAKAPSSAADPDAVDRSSGGFAGKLDLFEERFGEGVTAELSGKCIQLIRDLLPAARRVTALANARRTREIPWAPGWSRAFLGRAEMSPASRSHIRAIWHLDEFVVTNA